MSTGSGWDNNPFPPSPLSAHKRRSQNPVCAHPSTLFTLIACSTKQGVRMTCPNGSARKGGSGRHAPLAASCYVVKANNKVLIDMLLKEVDILPVYFQTLTEPGAEVNCQANCLTEIAPLCKSNPAPPSLQTPSLSSLRWSVPQTALIHSAKRTSITVCSITVPLEQPRTVHGHITLILHCTQSQRGRGTTFHQHPSSGF